MITLLLLVRATYIWVLFFAHIPFVVNHTFNATPPERLQHYDADVNAINQDFQKLSCIKQEILPVGKNFIQKISVYEKLSIHY